jgi:glycosyltransferase involved in cell wall biosynthesis
MHFVFLNPGSQLSGATLLLFHWARHLARAGQRVTARLQSDEPAPMIDLYRAEGIDLQAEFEVESDTVMICNTIAAAPLVMRTGSVVPTIWWLHEGETALRHLAANPDHLAAFEMASAIVIPSATIRDRVYRSFLLRVPDSRVHIVPPGLEPPNPGHQDQAEARHDGRLQVMCVGSITPLKRQSDLIKAVASLPDLPIECVFVGRPDLLEDEARELADRSPERFRFVGELPHQEAMRLLAQTDVLAHVSTSECLPLAPLEAGLRARPVILSDLPAHEGVWRHGVNCLMYPAGDVPLLAHMVRILATDAALRTRLGNEARRTAGRFRYDVFLTRLDLVLASLRWPLTA